MWCTWSGVPAHESVVSATAGLEASVNADIKVWGIIIFLREILLLANFEDVSLDLLCSYLGRVEEGREVKRIGRCFSHNSPQISLSARQLK